MPVDRAEASKYRPHRRGPLNYVDCIALDDEPEASKPAASALPPDFFVEKRGTPYSGKLAPVAPFEPEPLARKHDGSTDDT
jgi:hypothetical protein